MPIRDEAINVFMGLPGDDDRLELTYNFGVDSYELGTGYNHIAITAPDLDGTLDQLKEQGIEPGEAAVHRPRGRLADLLRARSGRLPDRDHRGRAVGRHLAGVGRTSQEPEQISTPRGARAQRPRRIVATDGPRARRRGTRDGRAASAQAPAPDIPVTFSARSLLSGPRSRVSGVLARRARGRRPPARALRAPRAVPRRLRARVDRRARARTASSSSASSPSARPTGRSSRRRRRHGRVRRRTGSWSRSAARSRSGRRRAARAAGASSRFSGFVSPSFPVGPGSVATLQRRNAQGGFTDVSPCPARGGRPGLELPAAHTRPALGRLPRRGPGEHVLLRPARASASRCACAGTDGAGPDGSGRTSSPPPVLKRP